jgi:hypothetical protein
VFGKVEPNGAAFSTPQGAVEMSLCHRRIS